MTEANEKQLRTLPDFTPEEFRALPEEERQTLIERYYREELPELRRRTKRNLARLRQIAYGRW